ncbi:NADPH-dependent glutamate synthase beta subunit-like oxidoreductase [Bradyrhizobium sp. USDA 4354]
MWLTKMYAPETLAALTERLEIGIVGVGAEQPRLVPVPGDALAP